MAVNRWDPMRDFMSIQNELNRLFGRTFGDVSETDTRGSWAPAMDVYESDDRLRLVFELPGFQAGDVDIAVEDGVLTISGERKFYDSVNEDSFHRVERRFGTFHRRVALPKPWDASKIEATLSNGLLTVEVPRSEEAKPRRIEVKAAK